MISRLFEQKKEKKWDFYDGKSGSEEGKDPRMTDEFGVEFLSFGCGHGSGDASKSLRHPLLCALTCKNHSNRPYFGRELFFFHKVDRN